MRHGRHPPRPAGLQRHLLRAAGECGRGRAGSGGGGVRRRGERSMCACIAGLKGGGLARRRLQHGVRRRLAGAALLRDQARRDPGLRGVRGAVPGCVRWHCVRCGGDSRPPSRRLGRIAGLIVLLAGLFVFRRTLGLWHVDSSSSAGPRTWTITRYVGSARLAGPRTTNPSTWRSTPGTSSTWTRRRPKRSSRCAARGRRRNAIQRGVASPPLPWWQDGRGEVTTHSTPRDEIHFDTEETENERRTRRKRTEKRSTFSAPSWHSSR